MSNPTFAIRLYDSELLVVPAKHFCHLFAHEVHRFCSGSSPQPEAVAVELGPETCAAAASWLRELGAGSKPPRSLPVMLALMRRNRMIRPSFREKVMRLQLETGKDLSEFESETLHREFRYSSHNVLFMSPGDSIIEALRCALELGIPAYGVDLEETSGGIYEPMLIQDPNSSSGGLTAFVAGNLAYADASRDDEIDSRREFAMAARIKALLVRHKRLVFTCGMAHWLRIQRLLADNAVRPSPVQDSPAPAAGEFERLVVHPVLAAQHMDPFPPLVRAYETRRSAAGAPARRSIEGPPVAAETVFRSRLRSAYKRHFGAGNSRSGSPERTRDLGSLSQFEKYLDNLCRLNHRTVPDLSLLVQAARQMMSQDFVQTLADTFMEYPWASPENHPGCGVLQPPACSGQSTAGKVVLEGSSAFKRKLFIRSVPALKNSAGTPSFFFEWKGNQGNRPLPTSYTWRPWEYLISSMSYRAISSATAQSRKANPVVFEGSLLDGIDVKPTIRAWSRGSDSVFVRDPLHEAMPDVVSPVDGFPVVWILNPGMHPNSDWNLLYEPSIFMEQHLRDKALLLKVKSAQGTNLVALLAYGRARAISRRTSAGESFKVEQYHGIAVFQPICWTNRQFARWAEITQYKRNPICRDTLFSQSGMSELRNTYERAHGVKIGEHEWTTTLVLLALPYARHLLTVVAPEGYRLPGLVLERARNLGVKVGITSLKSFAPEEISRLVACPLVPVIGVEPEPRYSRSLEKALGEKQTDNRLMVPPEWLNFGGGR